MFKRDTALIWLGILLLSSMFLMGQESWPPPECLDMDGDGYGSAEMALCPNPQYDCADGNADINPGAIDIPDNGIDEDCDGSDAVPTGDPNLDLLVAFLADDNRLMQAFLIQDPTPGPGTDVTINGAIGGFCHWTMETQSWDLITSYDYQGYNESGLVMSGLRSGEFSMIGMWVLQGTLELSGTWNGWIYYQMPMNAGIGPLLEGRTWNVCNYDDGCTNDPGVLPGTAFFTADDLP